jgi:hypothetical protein
VGDPNSTGLLGGGVQWWGVATTVEHAVSYWKGIAFISIVVYFPVSRRELKYSRCELMNHTQKIRECEGPKKCTRNLTEIIYGHFQS